MESSLRVFFPEKRLESKHKKNQYQNWEKYIWNLSNSFHIYDVRNMCGITGFIFRVVFLWGRKLL